MSLLGCRAHLGLAGGPVLGGGSYGTAEAGGAAAETLNRGGEQGARGHGTDAVCEGEE